MSVKNTRAEKKIRALRRALKKGRLPSYTNLEHWLELHGHAQTAGEARKLIIEKRVKVDSHPLGMKFADNKDIYWPYVPSELASRIEVEAR